MITGSALCAEHLKLILYVTLQYISWTYTRVEDGTLELQLRESHRKNACGEVLFCAIFIIIVQNY